MSLLNETSRFLVATGLCRLFTISKNDITVRFFPTRISRRLWVDSLTGKSKYEEMEQFYSAYLRPGDTVIDVGANIGWYTLIAAKTVGHTGKVFAFEPHPLVFDYLARNIQMNDFYNIRLYQSALGVEAGEVNFSDSSNDDMNRVTSFGEMKVQINRLDAFPLPGTTIDLLKVDVEGFELFVLQGSTGILSRTNTILFEVWEKHMTPNGYTFQALFELLDQAGFTILRATPDGYETVSESHDASIFTDLIAVKDVQYFKARMSGA